MNNTTINLGVVKKVATALGDLNRDVCFVGGAVVSIYADDPAAEEMRPTKDVDISLSIANFSELEKFREDLVSRGFKQSFEDSVICRFRYDDVLIDVMNTRAVAWAPSNSWFLPGFSHLQSFEIEGLEIKVLSLPYFLATKFEAFHQRGGDPRFSHDFEDIVYMLEFSMSIVELINIAPQEVKSFLKKEIQDMIDLPLYQEAIYGHLNFELRNERFKNINIKLGMITAAS
jgi:hypothetical protein